MSPRGITLLTREISNISFTKIVDACIVNISVDSSKFNCFREDRLKFWSDPDKEVKLAKDTGVTVFRMGVDWSRIMPVEPTKGIKEAVSQENIMTRYVLHILYVSMHFLLFCHFFAKTLYFYCYAL